MKQRHFREILSREMNRVCYGVIGKKYRDQGLAVDPCYHFVDLTAGPGVVSGQVGSPLIFASLAMEQGHSFFGWFCEADLDSATRLQSQLDEMGDLVADRSRVYPEDHSRAAHRIAESLHARQGPKFGMIYWDGNGDAILPVPTLLFLAEQFRKMDILLHVSATAIKRSRGVKKHSSFKGKQSLRQQLEQIGKRNGFVRRKYSQHEWTFILLTNDDRRQGLARIGFHHWSTQEGMANLYELEHTKKEQAELWPARLL